LNESIQYWKWDGCTAVWCGNFDKGEWTGERSKNGERWGQQNTYVIAQTLEIQKTKTNWIEKNSNRQKVEQRKDETGKILNKQRKNYIYDLTSRKTNKQRQSR
jgi:hypothetical protein